MRGGGVAAVGSLLLALLLAACAGNTEPVTIDESYDGNRIVIRDLVGTLEVVTIAEGGETSVHADLRANQVDLLPIRLSGGTLTIEWLGEPDRPRRWWEFWRGRWMADLERLQDYPSLVLEVPADVTLEVDSIVGEWTVGDRQNHLRFNAERGGGSIGATGSADISIDGHAEIDLGPVAETLEISISGSGSVTGATAGEAEIAISGSGEVTLGDIAGATSINIAGSGDARIGDSASVDARISGSGDVALGAIDGSMRAVVLGSGNMTAVAVNGAFSASISGSGKVEVGAGRGDPFEVSISGAGDVRFGGTGVNVEARLSGSGNLFLGALEGDLNARTSGSGRVEVGEQ